MQTELDVDKLAPLLTELGRLRHSLRLIRSERDYYRRRVQQLRIPELRAENRELRKRVKALQESRNKWREEAKAWKWGALHK